MKQSQRTFLNIFVDILALNGFGWVNLPFKRT